MPKTIKATTFRALLKQHNDIAAVNRGFAYFIDTQPFDNRTLDTLRIVHDFLTLRFTLGRDSTCQSKTLWELCQDKQIDVSYVAQCINARERGALKTLQSCLPSVGRHPGFSGILGMLQEHINACQPTASQPGLIRPLMSIRDLCSCVAEMSGNPVWGVTSDELATLDLNALVGLSETAAAAAAAATAADPLKMKTFVKRCIYRAVLERRANLEQRKKIAGATSAAPPVLNNGQRVIYLGRPGGPRIVDTASAAWGQQLQPGAVSVADTSTKKASSVKKKAGPVKKKSGPVKKKSGPAKKKSGPATKKADSAKKKAGPTKKKSGPAKKKSGLATKKAGPATKKADRVKKKSGPAKKKAGPATKKADRAKKKAGPVNRGDAPAKKKASRVVAGTGSTSSTAWARNSALFHDVARRYLSGFGGQPSVRCDKEGGVTSTAVATAKAAKVQSQPRVPARSGAAKTSKVQSRPRVPARSGTAKAAGTVTTSPMPMQDVTQHQASVRAGPDEYVEAFGASVDYNHSARFDDFDEFNSHSSTAQPDMRLLGDGADDLFGESAPSSASSSGSLSDWGPHGFFYRGNLGKLPRRALSPTFSELMSGKMAQTAVGDDHGDHDDKARFVECSSPGSPRRGGF